MADHLTDEEQLQQLKNWWKENGVSLVMAILVGLTAYFGFQWWQTQQQRQAEQASAMYSELLVAVQPSGNESLSDENISTASYLVDQIQESFPKSQYAANAALLKAKLAINQGELDLAAESLMWVLEQGGKTTSSIAALRLSRVYFAQGKYDDALTTINTVNDEAYTSLSSELRGDILLAQNNIDGAKEAYQQAINTLGDTSSFRQRLLPIKLSNLSTGDIQ